MRYMLIILMLLLIGSAAATDTQVYNGWIYHGEDVSINNEVYTISVSTTTKIFAEHTTKYLVVTNNSCEYSDIAKICLENTEYDTSAKRWKARIKAYSIKPKIAITRTIDHSTIPVKGYGLMTTTITNSGGNVAANATFIDEFGEEFIVSDASPGRSEGSRIVWEGHIAKSRSIDLSYRIYPQDLVDRTYKASLTYFDGFESQTMYSSALRLRSTPFFDVTMMAPPRTMKLGKHSNLTLNLSNIHEYPTTVDNVTISFSDGLEITEYPQAMSRANRTFSWNGIVPRNSTSGNLSRHKKAFFFRFKAIKAGGNSVVATCTYTDEDDMTRHTETIKNDLDITFKDDLEIWTSLWSGEKLESYEDKLIRVWIQNKNTGMNFTNVSVQYETTLPGFENMSIELLTSGEFRRIVDRTITLPDINKSESGRLKITVRYETPEGDKRHESLERKYTVYPITDLGITHAIGKTVMEGGEEVSVVVSMKNTRTIDLSGIVVKDELWGFKKTGVSETLLDINTGDIKTAYRYIIKAPRVREQTVYNLTTLVSYSDNRTSYRHNKTSRITVKPKQLKVTMSRVFTDSKVHEGEFSSARYTVTNHDTEPAYNIRLHFPVQKESDLVGAESYDIKLLDPGENVQITDAGQLRIKKNGSLVLKKPWLEYMDIYNNTFEKNGTETKLAVVSGYGTGPMVIVDRNLTDLGNGSYRLNYTLRNVGDQEAVVTMQDQGESWEQRIDAGSQRELSLDFRFEGNASKKLDDAVVSYPCMDNICRTGSDEITLLVEEEVIEETEEEQAAEEEIVVDEVEPEAEEVIEDDEEPNRSFIVSIWEGIKRFLRGIFPGGN